MFQNQRYMTKGIQSELPPMLQLLLWQMVDQMKVPAKDYLQVFKLSEENGHQKITHIQEQPAYEKTICIVSNHPPVTAKIYIIDDIAHSTMLFSSEY